MIAPAPDVIGECLERHYGLTGALARLPGEHVNFRLTASDGRAFVVKLMDRYDEALVDLEFQLVERAHAAGAGIAVPRCFTTITGHATTRCSMAPDGSRVRVLEFVPGTTWGEAASHPAGLFEDLGRVLGRIDRALSAIAPGPLRTHDWDLARAGLHRRQVTLVPEPDRRRLLDWAFLQHAGVVPRLAELPHSYIHGDANDENVLVSGDRVTGLIDFGDSLWNPTVCELAIALAYAMLDEPDPLARGAEVVAAYHAERPLDLEELNALVPLVLGRLSVTVATAAERRTIDPDHPTWFVTEDRAWRLLERLADVNPADAAARLSEDTGLDPRAGRGAPVEELLARRRRSIGPSLSIAYREPLKIVKGRGPSLVDDRGRAFLDLVNNVCHVGHCHPRVVEAAARQMADLNTNTRYLHDNLVEYAEHLTATLPDPLEVCYFVNSGTEANELALRLTMAHTGRRDVLVVDGAYHGHTARLVAASPYKFMGPGGSGAPEPWVHVVPMPDGYRGAHRGHDGPVGVAYGDDVKRAIDASAAPIAAFLTESLLSCGGQIVPPPGWLETAFRHVRDAGGVCIVDEVQVGFGRVGTHFWGFEQQGVVPDVVVLGKPIGNGHPMGAVVTTRAIAESFANGMEFFSTFGGNPVSCAVGLAVLDVIRDERLQGHALDVGTRFLEGLRGLMARHAIVGDVRGSGLFIGVELVRDRATLEPATREADDLIDRLQRRGILLSTDGPHHNVLKIKPPMVITAEDVDMVVRVLDDELGQ
jgi:4-aminobutyrate aminotransferase-like enzyme/aminoglycoside phosphotransferase (APT) family kinase protein